MCKIENKDMIKFLKDYAKDINSKLLIYGTNQEYIGDGTEDNIYNHPLFIKKNDNRNIYIEIDDNFFEFRFLYYKPISKKADPDLIITQDSDSKTAPAYHMDLYGNLNLVNKYSNRYISKIEEQLTFQDKLTYFFNEIDIYSD